MTAWEGSAVGLQREVTVWLVSASGSASSADGDSAVDCSTDGSTFENDLHDFVGWYDGLGEGFVSLDGATDTSTSLADELGGFASSVDGFGTDVVPDFVNYDGPATSVAVFYDFGWFAYGFVASEKSVNDFANFDEFHESYAADGLDYSVNEMIDVLGYSTAVGCSYGRASMIVGDLIERGWLDFLVYGFEYSAAVVGYLEVFGVEDY